MARAQRDIFAGLIRLHVLHHASREPIYGLEMIQELSRHGYRLGPGTLFPLLHGMEAQGLLVQKPPAEVEDPAVFTRPPLQDVKP
jgi:PadR family transcriptional regulator PadR